MTKDYLALCTNILHEIYIGLVKWKICYRKFISKPHLLQGHGAVTFKLQSPCFILCFIGCFHAFTLQQAKTNPQIWSNMLFC